MAQSLAHRWGQIIGDVFELFVRNILSEIAGQHGLYLDYKKPRKARARQTGGRDLSKVTWRDSFGNRHDLDYVLERGGTEEALGIPVAFVESAWRRYTKHSKNKVQEIEAAVIPIAQTFSRFQPFCGAVLAGEFTRNALSQLISKGFSVLHVPYSSIIAAFQSVGIDAASEDGPGGTKEADFKKKIAAWERLSSVEAADILIARWSEIHASEIALFKQRLIHSISRTVTLVRVTILRGNTVELHDVESAIGYLIEEEHSGRLRDDAEQRESFEIQIRFCNEARIEATFPSRQEAIAFLRTLDG
jgi:hypothetical protein